MPLLKNESRIIDLSENGAVIETLNYNSVKIVGSTPDNELNITPIFIEEGFYDAETKIFTSYKVLDEIILDSSTYTALDLEATQLVLDNNGSVTCHQARKITAYKHVAGILGIALDSYTVV